MPEMVLPGVYIEVRDEGLIGPGRVSLGNIGIVGTASKGPLDTVQLLGSYGEAVEVFGNYDAYTGPTSLTLVRALELAFKGGASTVFARRVGAGTPKASGYTVAGDTVSCAKLEALTAGTWGDNIQINVTDAADGAFVQNEKVPLGASLKPSRKPTSDGRNRVTVKLGMTGQTKVFDIVYAPTAPTAGKVQIDATAGTLLFDASETPKDNGANPDDEITVSYAVDKANSRKVTLRYGSAEEVYTVADGGHLMDLVAGSALVKKASGAANPLEIPKKSPDALTFVFFGKGADTPGSNGEGATDADYNAGLGALLGEPAHIILAAGQDESAIGDELAAHVANASTDKMKGERIAVVGTGKDTLNDVRNHKLNSDRVVLVSPGIKVTDAATGKPVDLPGAYTAAVIAGMISARDAHVSLTNKPVPVGALTTRHTPDKLEALVNARVLAVEEAAGRGIRVVKAITTENGGAFHQITTRRIVDFARYGVRSAASPYIGRLNNERVRGAMKATITGFLQEMLDDEKLIAFTVDVSATRAEEIAGIARVTIGLQPTFSIDFVKVTMILS